MEQAMTLTQTYSECMPKWVRERIKSIRRVSHWFHISCLVFVSTEFIVSARTRCGRNFNADSDGFEIHDEWRAEQRKSIRGRGFGTLFYFVPRLVRMEFVVRTGARYGRTFNTDLDKFEVCNENSQGAYKVHSGCLAHIFISYARNLLLRNTLAESLTPSATDSKCTAKWAIEHMKSIRGLWDTFLFCANISYVWSL